jgi:hypothetical protein
VPNELLAHSTAGQTLYLLLFDARGQVWDGSAFVTPAAAGWTDYALALLEIATTGIYRGPMPAVPAGVYAVAVRAQAGAAPAVDDAIVSAAGQIQWNGSAAAAISSRATPSDIDDAITALTTEAIRL